MLAIIFDTDGIACAEASARLTKLLLCYGISEVLTLEEETDLADIHHRYSTQDEVVLVSALQDISSLAIRRLTLSTVRLPTCIAVWTTGGKAQLAAARVHLSDIKFNGFSNVNNLNGTQLNGIKPNSTTVNSAKLDSIVRALRNNPSIAHYTLQQVDSADALRIGGSFSTAGIRKYFYKHAKGRGAIKLNDEVRFYQSLPLPLQQYYPELVSASKNEGGVSMNIEYKEYPNLRDLLLNLQIRPAEAVQLIGQVLKYEYRQAFCSYRQPTPENYLQDYHYDRVWRRIQISTELDEDFNGLVNARWLRVNGRNLPNIPAMLLRLEEDKAAGARLDPGGVSPFVHSDLHLENILCDVAGGRFWLIDPRGYPSCDIYYDLGKLAHSYNSKYDLLHEGRHEASFAFRDDTAVIDFHFTSDTLTQLYAEVNDRMTPVIHELFGGREDPADVDLRVRFNEAMHFCSDMPFHIRPGANPNVAVPIYAIGAQLLAEVLEKLDVDVDTCVEMQAAGLRRLAECGQQPWRFEG
ncbi:hypothetical protein G7Y79_00035g070930 [Physcia stellaris]|nr:hypothetical protein G7Y79_00035g070930 [Physcia stellaris]